MSASRQPTSTSKVPITARALVQRVQRKLAGRFQVLRRLQGAAAEKYGPYVILDGRSDAIRTHVVRDRLQLRDVVALGRELGVVQSWEEVQS